MKHLISILTGSLFACVSFVQAEEAVSDNTNMEPRVSESEVAAETDILQELNIAEAESATEAPVQNAEIAITEQSIDQNVVAEVPSQPAAKVKAKQPQAKKASIWDKFLNMFKSSEPKAKTCEEAFNQMSGISVNFSNTSDFAENGDKYMNLYYQKIKETNSFGTRSSNLNVSPEVIVNFVEKWSKVFSGDKKTVLWNLSNNKSLGDNVIDSIDLSNMYSLNLSNTSISDLTINKIISILNIQNTGKLVCVNLSGTKVSEAVVESLKAAFQKSKTEFESKNPGKTYNLEGDNNSGVIFNKLPDFLKQKPATRKLTNKTVSTPSEAPVVEETLPVDSVASDPVLETAGNTTPDVLNAEATSSDIETIAEDTVTVPSEEPVASIETTNEQINEALSEADKLIANVDQNPGESNAISDDSLATTSESESVDADITEATLEDSDETEVAVA